MDLPKVVSVEEWEAANAEIVAKEKAAIEWWRRHDEYPEESR